MMRLQKNSTIGQIFWKAVDLIQLWFEALLVHKKSDNLIKDKWTEHVSRDVCSCVWLSALV